jgi:Fur family transcriptional regulator, ferric uptake regulator
MQRDTRQRQVIREVFERHHDPLSTGEIMTMGREALPSLGMATVYRALRDLVEEGQLVMVELPGKPPRYERAGKHHHHHFLCRRCDKAFELDGCAGGWRELAPAGFMVESHEIILYGLCRQCTISP